MIVLRSLRVWNWRGLDEAVLDDLAPDLNLVVGPNESGKSRLFEALHYALFERNRGTGFGKGDLQSWHADDPPEVEVCLHADGHDWRLRKRFLKREFARLEGAGVTLRDDEAEARMRQLLGTRTFDRKPGPHHFGIWPLLWLAQGASGVAPHEHLTEDGRGRIRDLLAAEVDQVAAGPVGEHVLARVAEEYERYWNKRGGPRGELRLAIEESEAAEASVQDARSRWQAAHDCADEVVRVEESLAALTPRLRERRDALRTAEQGLSAVEKLHQQIEVQQARTAELRTLAEQAGRELREHLDLVAEVAALRSQCEAIHVRVVAAAEELTACQARFEGAASEVASSEGAESAAGDLLARANQTRRRREAERFAKRARTAFEEASALRARLREREARLRGIRVDPLGVQRLREAVGEQRVADARLEAAAVRVRLQAATDLVVGGEPVPRGEHREWRVERTRVLTVDGLLELEIVPGEGGLGPLRDEARDARTRVERLLQELGVESLGAAEVLLEERTRLQGLADLDRERLRDHAPDGVDALEKRALEAEAALAAQYADIAPEGALPLLYQKSESESEITDPEEAVAAHRLAREALEAARVGRDTAAERRTEAQVAHTTLESDLERLEAERSRREQQLADSKEEEALTLERDRLQEAWTEARHLLTGLEARFRKGGGETAQAEVDRAQQSLERLQQDHDSLREKARRAQVTLEVYGEQNLYEELQRAEALAESVGGALERTQRRATAAARLREALEQARQQAQERLVAPVVGRVEPYLREIFPGSDLHLNPEWQVLGLRTAHTQEPFHLLSGGAREQLSVVVRLGLAEVLGAGERLPVVLDDALVNSDPARVAGMLRVLWAAARNLQIVVFSCHEVAFDGLGATKVYRLQAPDGPRFHPPRGTTSPPPP
jgi:DNA repair exonuclease SbcCD ATPase subunit